MLAIFNSLTKNIRNGHIENKISQYEWLYAPANSVFMLYVKIGGEFFMFTPDSRPVQVHRACETVNLLTCNVASCSQIVKKDFH